MQVSCRQQNRRAMGQGPEPATAEPGHSQVPFSVRRVDPVLYVFPSVNLISK